VVGLRNLGPEDHSAAHGLLSVLRSEQGYAILRPDKDALAQLQILLVRPGNVRIEQTIPSTADLRLSETLDDTRVLSAPIDFSDPAQPNMLELHYRDFSVTHAILVTMGLFIVTQFITPLIRPAAVELWRVMTGSFLIRRGPGLPERRRGVLVPETVTSGLLVGATRYEEIIRSCGPPITEEVDPVSGTRTITYEGVRDVPRRSRRYGWFVLIRGWATERQRLTISFADGLLSAVRKSITRDT